MEKIANVSDGRNSPFFPEYNLSNSLDGDPDDDYSAAVEGTLLQTIHICFRRSKIDPYRR